jgi:hypothetical protein
MIAIRHRPHAYNYRIGYVYFRINRVCLFPEGISCSDCANQYSKSRKKGNRDSFHGER